MNPAQSLLDQTIDRFWETVPPLWGTIRSHVRTTAAERFDISFEQFHILRHIRRGVVSISALAIAKNISRPAVSQAVEVLVKKGLLTRVQSTQDRRFVELALTGAGNALLDAVITETRIWMRERLKILDSRELETVIQAMEVLNKVLD